MIFIQIAVHSEFGMVTEMPIQTPPKSKIRLRPVYRYENCCMLGRTLIKTRTPLGLDVRSIPLIFCLPLRWNRTSDLHGLISEQREMRLKGIDLPPCQ
jgi:hypothetical protein